MCTTAMQSLQLLCRRKIMESVEDLPPCKARDLLVQLPTNILQDFYDDITLDLSRYDLISLIYEIIFQRNFEPENHTEIHDVIRSCGYKTVGQMDLVFF